MHHVSMTNRQMPEGWRPADEAASDRTLRVVLVVVLAATITGGGIDLVLDAPSSWKSAHVLFELTLLTGAVLTMIWFWRGWLRTRHDLVEAQQVLVERAVERDAWRASAESVLAGLGKAIDEKLSAWGLSPVEREVALFLLKGWSHKRIAFVTGRSERTVRQHAVAVYQKSGLNGRAELAAFFLEGIPNP
jgi:DNA-binding CsgD family transcriptional regulator